MKRLARQFSAFAMVGLVAAVVHYGVLIGLVEFSLAPPVYATMAGYVFGGLASYSLNRNWAFKSARAHREATWRFTVVAGVGFVLTGILMTQFHDRWGIQYVVSAVLTSALVMFWSFIANRLWTFKEP